MVRRIAFCLHYCFIIEYQRPAQDLFVVLDEVGDVLAGGLAQPFPFFADPLMQVAGDLSAQVFVVAILGHLFRIFVTQAYPKGYEKAITNTTKE